MPRRMTIVFDDEALYTQLKVEAARTHRPAKDIVARALAMLFEATPEEQDAILVRARMRGFAREGGPAVEKLLESLGLAKERTPGTAVS
ncbi:MAG TPA: hypothetical protein VNM91_10760 [Dehalococcoidia bacterium]|nr:hypothetical protein [Dehalococcoidia bacterium]